jgi:hypothetical protein
MAEVVERVARLEERFDGVTSALTEVKESIHRVEVRLDAGLAEVRAEIRDLRTGLTGLRAEMQETSAALRTEINSEVAALRDEIQTQFRWLMSGLGGVVLAVLVAMLSR